MAQPTRPVIVDLDNLPNNAEAHRFEGAEHGDAPVSMIFVHAPPGGGPMAHRHPYKEVFYVEAGEATFEVGGEAVVVRAGNMVVAPADVIHRFTNSGDRELRIVAVHPSPIFRTQWLSDEESTS